MVEALEETGAYVTPRLRQQLLREPKANTSGHAHYANCYDDSVRKLVERFEGWTIDTFEYTFGA